MFSGIWKDLCLSAGTLQRIDDDDETVSVAWVVWTPIYVFGYT